MDSAEEVTGYDDVDAGQVFNGAGNKPEGEGRRRGKKNLSTRSSYRSRPKRSILGIFSLSLRHFEDTAKAMLAVSIGALVLCGILLYFTHKMQPPFNFYGALAASMVVVALLFYTASRLVGRSG